MGENYKYDELIKCIDDLVLDISINGFNNSFVLKLESVLKTITDIDDVELYNHPKLLLLINIAELYKEKNNILLDIMLKKIKISSILSNISSSFNEDNAVNTSKSEKEVSCGNNIEKEAKLSSGEEKFFILENGKKKIIDKQYLPETGEGAFKLISRYESGEVSEEIRYTIDQDGYVLSESHIPQYKYLDYDEAYTESIEDALDYEDFINDKKDSKIKESDL